ncbi:MAG TPA: F0F1 ATP synthase subunit B [Chitinophagaceae bacterium]|nr:F0F1 ATP synthase subunit B [Chitinophagaceae bacterium]
MVTDTPLGNGGMEIFMQLLTPGLGLIIWTLLAFLAVFFILKKFAWPAILGGLRKREQTIADSLAHAEKIKSEMAQMKSENEAILAKAREERSQMLKEAREMKDKIINEAKEQAKIDANKIITDAQLAIDAQKMAALTEVKNEVGKLVIEVTEKVLRRELRDKQAQEEHIKNLVKELRLT